jgi:hypothetical protein
VYVGRRTEAKKKEEEDPDKWGGGRTDEAALKKPGDAYFFVRKTGEEPQGHWATQAVPAFPCFCKHMKIHLIGQMNN